MWDFISSNWLGFWGAAVSTFLAVLRIWEFFFRDRIRLATTYSFDSRPEVGEEVTIANLSADAVQIAYWTIGWEPRWWRPAIKPVDCTPYEGGYAFRIGGRDSHTMRFAAPDNLRWNKPGCRLILKLHLFGRRRARRVIIKKAD
ncbi:hypothetical protein [Terrihabitans sp. B22-R8]|uniref:hypothetical protein n=1 Tax=Terrihabitans sp. B22-R8 TaxID=3425128 RepID=UPI00403C9EAC